VKHPPGTEIHNSEGEEKRGNLPRKATNGNVLRTDHLKYWGRKLPIFEIKVGKEKALEGKQRGGRTKMLWYQKEQKAGRGVERLKKWFFPMDSDNSGLLTKSAC